MGGEIQSSGKARKTCIPAVLIDFEDLRCFDVKASGFSSSGCHVDTDKVQQLKSMVGLRIEGMERMIRAHVVSNSETTAELRFDFSRPGRTERRKEPRRRVLVFVTASDRAGRKSVRCVINEASRSGCRLLGEELQLLPDDILITVPGLGTPVLGTVVWRKGAAAGVQLMWDFCSKSPFAPDRSGLAEGDKEPGKKASAFAASRPRKPKVKRDKPVPLEPERK